MTDIPRPPDDEAEFADWITDEIHRFDEMTLDQIRDLAKAVRARVDARGDADPTIDELTMMVRLAVRTPSRILNREDSDTRLHAWFEGFGTIDPTARPGGNNG